ncbi:MAG: hypothetical protein WDM92_08205 [Caulobacteraceae bacterium]
MKLAEALHGCADGAGLPAALKAYEDERRIEVLKIQNSARNSTEWFETIDRYQRPSSRCSSPIPCLTRSQRVSHENLRLRDPAWLSAVERWFRRPGGRERRRPAADVHALRPARPAPAQPRGGGADPDLCGGRRGRD